METAHPPTALVRRRHRRPGVRIKDRKAARIIARRQRGESIRQIARQEHVTTGTVMRVCKRPLDGPLSPVAVAQAMASLRDQSLGVAEQAWDELTPDRLAAAGDAGKIKDLAIVAGIATDKARLLNDQSTANVAVKVLVMRGIPRLPPAQRAPPGEG